MSTPNFVISRDSITLGLPLAVSFVCELSPGIATFMPWFLHVIRLTSFTLENRYCAALLGLPD